MGWLGQLLGLPAEWHGHIEDTASIASLTAFAAARAAMPDRRVVVCTEHTHSSIDKAARVLELEVRRVPVDDAYRMRADLLDTGDACAVVATVGSTSTTSMDPVAEIAARKGEAWLHVDAAYAGSSWVCPEYRSQDVQPQIRSSSTRTSGCSPGWAARACGRRGRTTSGAHSASCPSICARGRGDQPQRGEHPARPAVSRAAALGRAALLRARRAAGADPRAREACRPVRGVGARRPGLGGLRAAAALGRLLPARRLGTRTTRPCSSARTRPASCSSRTRGSTAATSCASRSGTLVRPKPTSARVGGAARVRAVIFDLWDTLALWPSAAVRGQRSARLARHIDDFEHVWATTTASGRSAAIEDVLPRLGLDDGARWPSACASARTSRATRWCRATARSRRSRSCSGAVSNAA